MSIHTLCPSCRRKVRAPEQALGRKAKCPNCGGTFIVKKASEQPTVAPEPRQRPVSHAAASVPVVSQQSNIDAFEGGDSAVVETSRSVLSGGTGRSRQSRQSPLYIALGSLFVGSLLVIVAAGIVALFATDVVRVNTGEGRDGRQAETRGTGGRPETSKLAVNSDTFKSLYRVAKEIEGAQEVGLTRSDFGRLLQHYATELSVAKDNIKTDEERNVLRLYTEALEIWKDSASLWDAMISMPMLKREAERYVDTFGRGSARSDLISLRFHYNVLLIKDKLPIENFPSKGDNEVAALAKHYNLPVKEWEGWRWIDADSFKELWLLAGKKATDADKLAKGR